MDNCFFVKVFLLTSLTSVVLADGRPAVDRHPDPDAMQNTGSDDIPEMTSLARDDDDDDDYEAALTSLLYDNATFNQVEMRRIADIKRDILTKLGMSRAPDVKGVNTTVHERRQIMRLYKKSVDELHGKSYSLIDDDVFYASQFHSFADIGVQPSRLSAADANWKSRDKLRLFFDVDISEPAEPDHETIVTSATLKLYKSGVHADRLVSAETVDHTIRLDAFQIIDIEVVDGIVRTQRRSVDSKLISLSQLGSEKFDVSRAVQDWIRDPATNLGLEVAVTDSRYRLHDIVEFVTMPPPTNAHHVHLHATGRDDVTLTSVDAQLHAPTLNVLTQQRPILARRHRRQAMSSGHVTGGVTERADCVPGDGETRCCRYPVTISFRDIGWSNWVLLPESYQSYYCYGVCPLGYRVAHGFASIKSIMLDVKRSAAAFRLTCAATRMGHLSLAHYDNDGRLVVSVFDNMWPEECKCA